MQSTKSPKLAEITNNYEGRCNAIDFENAQIKSEEDLKSRISMMKRYLDSLKSQLHTERNMLQKEKLELFNYTIHQQGKDDASMLHLPVTSARTLPEFATIIDQPQSTHQHLKNIEQKCDMELAKLEKYVENINDLKSYWGFLKVCHANEFGDQQSNRSLRKPRRMHEGVPSAEWLNRNRTFV